ncbi:MAG: helix-turn-helix domain-containing protein [Actinomycetota bacterium]
METAALHEAAISFGVTPEDALVAGPLVVSPEVACAAWLEGRPLSLTARQVRIIGLLVSARGRLLSREALFEESTGRPHLERSRAVDMDMWRIRAALGAYAPFLRSVRKVGWKLDVTALERATYDAAASTTSP